MGLSIKIKIRRKDMKQIGLIFGELFGNFIEDLIADFPQPEKPRGVKQLDKELLSAIAEAYDVTNTNAPEATYEESQIIRNIQILKKDENLFKDVSNVVLMFHMMALGFDRICISKAGEPPRYGYDISPKEDLVSALEEDAKKKAT